MAESRGQLVFVDTEMGRIVGGAQTCLLRLIPELSRRGWRSTVLCEPPYPPFASVLRASGVEVMDSPIKYPRLVEDSAKRLAYWVNSRSPAAYILSVSSGSGWAAMPLLNSDIPTLAIVHSDDEVFYHPLRHYQSVTDVAVAVSVPIENYLIHSLSFASSRVRRAPYGVEKLPSRERRQGNLRVAYVGRLDEHDKQISVLAEAICQLDDAPIDFTIAGTGPDTVSFRQLTRPNGRVKFLGYVSPEAALETIAKSDCLVLTSTGREGMPLTVLEARACGVVPVLSNIPAHAALVHHGNDGLLVPSGDANALAEALRSLSGDSPRLRTMAERSHIRADQTTVGIMADAYEEAIAFAMSKRESAPARAAVPLMQTCISPWPAALRKLRESVRRARHSRVYP
jgi:glycosyltransferase involved in cell wall biosynthesis